MLAIALLIISGTNPDAVTTFGFNLWQVKAILIVSFWTTVLGVAGIATRSLVVWRSALTLSVSLLMFISLTLLSRGLYFSATLAAALCYSSLLRALQVVSSNIFNPQIGFEFDTFLENELPEKVGGPDDGY
jgi:hypothetical protein